MRRLLSVHVTYRPLIVGYVLCNVVRMVLGHGRLMEPPSRSSMWRLGYNTPHNYQDNELFCGGFQNQWGTNDGKCGICGDPWQGPCENEAGGKYALGIITRQYKTNSQIPVIVEITAPHKGWFEFRLCKNDNVKRAATQACLDEHLLKVVSGTGTRYHVTFDYPMDYDLVVQLPEGLKCQQCVFQWKYNAGNSWGVDENGTGCVGCGPQEQFRGCADVAIGDNFTDDYLTPQHEYTPVTIVTNKHKPPETRTNENYIDYKDAVNSIKSNRNYGRRWWKDEGQDNEDDGDNDAKIFFETLFQNGTEGHLLHRRTSDIYIYISAIVVLLLHL